MNWNVKINGRVVATFASRWGAEAFVGYGLGVVVDAAPAPEGRWERMEGGAWVPADLDTRADGEAWRWVSAEGDTHTAEGGTLSDCDDKAEVWTPEGVLAAWEEAGDATRSPIW